MQDGRTDQLECLGVRSRRGRLHPIHCWKLSPTKAAATAVCLPVSNSLLPSFLVRDDYEARALVDASAVDENVDDDLLN